MSDLVATATEWLAATGAPNWILLLALLTRPSVWAKQVRDRLTPLLDKVIPTGGE